MKLPTSEIQSLKALYAEMFGWSFLELGEDYAVFENAGIHGGINPNRNNRTKAPLVIIETDEIELMQQKIRATGAAITMTLFSYPGGRRCWTRVYFTDKY